MIGRRYVFLDIDGVLNSVKYEGNRLQLPAAIITDLPTAMAEKIDTATVGNLNTITDALRAEIVISSSWRHLDWLASVLHRRGITAKIVGITPTLSRTTHDKSVPRGHEIAAWLEAAGVAEDAIVILDDDDDMADLAHRHIRTDYRVGLTEIDAIRAIALFG